MTDQTRYLIKPPAGFCAPFVVWAESKALARAYAAQWLGIELPSSTVISDAKIAASITSMSRLARITHAVPAIAMR